jgi:hypothetical protein
LTAGCRVRHRAAVRDAEPTTRSDGLGVVDPIRIPGAASVARAWSRLPRLGRAFVVLAAVDVALRVLGVGGLTLYLDLANPAAFFIFAIPHYALILLPTVLLLRRPDAAEATPLILRGAVALALVELVSEPLFTVLVLGAGPDLTSWALLQIAAVFARAGGYVAIALGMLALQAFAPGPAIRGLANLVAGVMIATAVTVVLLGVVFPPTDFGYPGMGGLTLLVGIAHELATVGLAVLGWAILRGTVDARRPVEATYIASGAILIAAANSFLTLGANLATMGQIMLGGPAAIVAPMGLGFLGTGAVLVLLVVAFGLGLADTSVRIPRHGAGRPLEPEPAREPVYWPSPGGEVPTFRPVEGRETTTTGQPAPPRRAENDKESPG